MYDDLEKFPELSKIEYNGHFRNFVYFTISIEDDKPRLHPIQGEAQIMKLTKLTHCYHIGVAEKEANKARNQANLCRIASTLQQRSNHRLIADLEDFLNGYCNLY
ncbi:MAG: hypothetical protein IM526_12815 [Microcystis sp. M38BS1]|nr:hypothetical protein [Microcystis sp. M38BS1]